MSQTFFEKYLLSIKMGCRYLGKMLLPVIFQSQETFLLTTMSNQNKTKDTVNYLSIGMTKKNCGYEVLERSCTQGWAGAETTSVYKQESRVIPENKELCVWLRGTFSAAPFPLSLVIVVLSSVSVGEIRRLFFSSYKRTDTWISV